jgi:para-nitrobenzyl esterase
MLAGMTILPAAAQTKGDPVVSAPSGRYRGLSEAGVRVFRGIRYGQDNTRRRFQAPLSPAPVRDIVAAQEFGPTCPQGNGRGAGSGEDCLFLNIWTTAADARARKPVAVYFHGGAYSGGTVIEPRVFGDRLAAGGDMVVVTVNHRLNALGYLYLARLDPRFPDSGNAGQLDLILALQWVRDNIAAFGGDPSRVTVFGQSGGGAKIATLMATPAAEGLFHRAWTMSGQQVTATGPLNATRRTKAFLGKLGATPGDLLTMPVEKLLEGLAAEDPILGGGVYMGPVLDMKWLTRHPFWPDAHPQGCKVPMVLGNTRDETRAFVDPGGAKVQGLDWDNLAEAIAPELRIDAHPEWVVAEYRAHFPGMSPVDLFYAATTAGRSWRGQVIEAEERAHARAAAWVYQLDFASPVQPVRGAPHGQDIPLIFGTLGAQGSLTGTGPESQWLSMTMMKAFANFAAAGDPNGRALPDWPKYELDRRTTMIFDKTTRAEHDPRKWERELFARIPYVQPGS